MRVRSLACIRVRIDDRTLVGCGRGWEEADTGRPPVCGRCGRPARVTGAYTVLDLEEPMMVTIDMRCSDIMCAQKGIYRMVGRCANCGTEDILFLITAGHEAPHSSMLGASCPVCGCRGAYCQRLAADDESPVG